MKLNIILSFACSIAALNTYAQVEQDTIVLTPDTAMIMFEEEPMPAYDYELAAPAVPAMEADYDYTDYERINKFKHNKKIKPEEKPDKRAAYSQGTGELLRQIRDDLVVPYSYNNTTEDNFVLIQFTVGKDSALYNPEILHSPGAEYTINATNVIEKLQYNFSPAMKNGKPVDSIIIVPIRFERQKYNQYDHYREGSRY